MPKLRKHKEIFFNKPLRHLPNVLTLSRIIFIPFIIFGIHSDFGYGFRLMSLALFFYACITDYLDGYIARSMKLVSSFGAFLDPVADKLLIANILLILAYRGIFDGFDIIAASIILFREIFIADLRKFVKLNTAIMAKFKTITQMLAVGFFLCSITLIGLLSEIILSNIMLLGSIFLWISAINSLITSINYLRYCFDSGSI